VKQDLTGPFTPRVTKLLYFFVIEGLKGGQNPLAQVMEKKMTAPLPLRVTNA
jgi:hypothetical protein